MRDLMECVQRKAVFIPMTIVYTGGVPAIEEGSSYASVSDDGTGLFTITFNRAFARAPVVVGNAIVATSDEVILNLVSVSTSAVQIQLNDDAGTAVDKDCHLHIVGFDAQNER